MKLLRNRNRSTDALVYIYRSVHSFILAEVEKYPDVETGGDLFGTFSHGDMPVIWWATGPGPEAIRQPTEFRQDANFTTKWQKHLMDNFALQYIGSWHSHHKLGLQQPSTGDERAAKEYARRHSRRRTLEIIATFDREGAVLRPYYYPNAQVGGWIQAEFHLLPGESPVHQKIEVIGDTPPWHSSNPQYPRSIGYAEAMTSVNSYENHQFLTISEQLKLELMNLSAFGLQISVEQRNDKYMIEIALDEDHLLAILVQESEGIEILAVRIISEHTIDDFTLRLREAEVITASKDGYRLEKLFSLMQQKHQQERHR